MAVENIKLVNALAPYILGLAGILSPLFTAKYFKNIELEKHKQSIVENQKIESYKDISKKLNTITDFSHLRARIVTLGAWNDFTSETKNNLLIAAGLNSDSDFDTYIGKANAIFCQHLDKTINELVNFSDENIFISAELKKNIQDIYKIKIDLIQGLLKQGVITDPHCYNKIEGKILICKEIISKEVLWQ